MNELYKFEIFRKLFHLTAIIFPLGYLIFDKKYILALLSLVTIFILCVDISRHFNSKVKQIVDNFLFYIMRDHERSGSFVLSGSSYMMLGFLITIILFSKGVVITSWMILIISDTFAALIGLRVESKNDQRKSLVGSVAFFVSAFFIGILGYFFLGYNTSFIIIVFSVFFTTCIEFYAKDIFLDDNLLIPPAYCISTYVLNFLF